MRIIYVAFAHGVQFPMCSYLLSTSTLHLDIISDFIHILDLDGSTFHHNHGTVDVFYLSHSWKFARL